MSFSSDIKNDLCAVPLKKHCCKAALLYGLLFPYDTFGDGYIVFTTESEKVCTLFSACAKSVLATDTVFEQTDGNALSESNHGYKLKSFSEPDRERICAMFAFEEKLGTELFACESCTAAFIRGLFLSCGTVSDPKSGYHLEFSFKSAGCRDAVKEFMNNQGFSPKSIDRKSGVFSLYFKNSESIEDIFTYIGAPLAAVSMMNVKIMRDIRNNENRRSNCDTANIYKSTEAAGQQLEAIKKLTENGRISLLPAELCQTAKLRLTYPEYSLSELAGLHEPPLTKSGISHRLKKIIDFANIE